MAVELVGLIASITGMAAVGAKVSTSLYSFASNVASAREDTSRLGDEVTALSLVFSQLATTLRAPGSLELTAEARDKVAWIVGRCEGTFGELQELLKGYKPSALVSGDSATDGVSAKKGGSISSLGLRNRVKYSFRKERILLLRSSLDSYKATLQLMLYMVEKSPRAQSLRKYRASHGSFIMLQGADTNKQ
jgi:hypothetical protein